MRHDPIRAPRIHPAACDCAACQPVRTIDARAILLAALASALPVYGLLWAAWTILP